MMSGTMLGKQRGISVMIVIFLLAVVSVMAISMVNLSTTQHMSSLYSLRGAQAYFAARAGMEYAVDQVIANGTCPGNPGAIPGLAEFTITIDGCVATPPLANPPFNEGGATYRIFRLTVTASSGNFAIPNVANRQITAIVRRLGP